MRDILWILRLLIFAAAITFAGIALAMGPSGGMGSGGIGGGNGHGMGWGGHMMGDDAYMNSPNYNQPRSPRYFQRRDPSGTGKLRVEIHERREELSRLFRQIPRDNQLIDRKIEELSRLEAEFDRQASDDNP